MKIRGFAAAAGLVAGLMTVLPAHAAGSAFGSGSAAGGCGGSILVAGANSSGNNWVFDVTVTCGTAAPQHVVIAGQWDAAVGGPVVGFGNGSLNIGRMNCGGNAGVSVQVAMVGSPLRTGTASVTRVC